MAKKNREELNAEMRRLREENIACYKKVVELNKAHIRAAQIAMRIDEIINELYSLDE